MTAYPFPIFDSSTLEDIPTDAKGVAYYMDGEFRRTLAQVKAHCPNATFIISITVLGDLSADFYDIENGDGTPMDLLHWTITKRADGGTPGGYASDYTWGQIKQVFGGAPLPLWWRSHPDNIASLSPPGIVGKQYAWPPDTGGHYDLSIFDDSYPPKPPLPPKPKDNDMGLSIFVDAAGKRHVAGVGADSRSGHAIVWSETGPNANTYTVWDLTALIHNQYPDQPLYTVQP